MFFFSLSSSYENSVQGAEQGPLSTWVQRALNSLNMSFVRQHIEFLSSLKTRATGYPGNREAANYIASRFLEYGLENVSLVPVEVITFVDHGSRLEFPSLGITVPLYAMWPNFVATCTTPPGGLVGPLVYAGSGYLEDFDGKPIDGSIVILDYDTDVRWLNAVKLGAKAVIFIGPSYLTSPAGDRFVKFLSRTPMNFPRFYADETTASILLKHLGEEARITSLQTWDKVVTWNVMGLIRGTMESPPDEMWPGYPTVRPGYVKNLYNDVIILSSYYDSYSDAPALAPGAQESCGVSGLLELARILAQMKPKNTVLFIAFGAHHQSLEGAIEFFREYIWPAEDINKVPFGHRLRWWFNFDMTTGTNVTYFTMVPGTQAAVGYGGLDWSTYRHPGLLFRELNEKLGRPKNLYWMTSGFDYSGTPWIYPSEHLYVLPDKGFAYDTDLTQQLGTPLGYTFTTAWDPRPFFITPFDTIDKVNFENLEVQLRFAYACVLKFLDDYKELMDTWYPPDPTKPPSPFNQYERRYEKGVTLGAHWCSLKGIVATWSDEKAFWIPVKPIGNDTITLVSIDYMSVQNIRYSWRWNRRWTIAKEDGSFIFVGAYSNEYYRAEGKMYLSAWIINQTDGRILYMPDLGRHRYAEEIVTIRPGIDPMVGDIGFVTVFPASRIITLDFGSPGSLSTPQSELGAWIVPDVAILRTDTHTPVESYGVWQESGYGIATFGIPAGINVEIYAAVAGARYPFILLINSTPERPLGEGYRFALGEQLILKNPTLNYAENFYWVSKRRLVAYLPGSAIFQRLEELETIIESSKKSLEDLKYTESFAQSAKAWSLGHELYTTVRSAIEDSTFVVPFLAAFLLPFAFLFERLVFTASGLKRIFSIIGVFAATLLFLYLFHPGFQLAASPPMVVLGFSVLILAFPVVLIVFSKAMATIESLRVRFMGRHEAEISRSSELLSSFSIGVQNMKKRKLRTTLTFTAIIFLIIGIVAFTSISSLRMAQVMAAPGGTPVYEGIYIRRDHWGRPGATGNTWRISDGVIDYLTGRFGDEAFIAPRAWKYTLYREIINPYSYDKPVAFLVWYKGNYVPAPVMLGLTPAEKEITQADKMLVAGRWFEPGDHHACILSEYQASKLGIKEVGVEVIIEGVPFHVIGIVKNDFAHLKDLDGEAITPIVLDWPEERPNPFNEHDPIEYIIILNYDDVIALGGYTASISIKPKDPEKLPMMAEEIGYMFSELQVYANLDERVFLVGTRFQMTVFGLNFQLVPLTLAMLSILNIMLGSVYERRREIQTYSTIGLSPLHVSTMFLTEALVFAIIGAILGYLLSVAFISFASSIGLAGVQQNYSSNFVIITILASMGVTMLSVLYPLRVCSRMVTPSLERVWKIPTNPVGNRWNIPLPFIASTEEEAKGMIGFIYEFLHGHLGLDAPIFSVSDIALQKGPEPGIICRTRLFPYDLGISQETRIVALSLENRWQIHILLNREMGPDSDWRRLNRNFINAIREQLLLWRTVKEEEKIKYIKMLEGD
jgi:ABC-type antimicrobial peptide transport system permease subunit